MASMLSMAMEEHTRVWKFWASLEDQLAQAKKEEDVLKVKILDLEKEKRLMNERVAMMEKGDLTALPDSTYEFFCTIFIPEGVESIDPNTGEKEVMDEEVDDEELEAGRGRHIIRNDVDILNDNESWRFALLEVNKALKLWRGDVVLPGVSFVTGHRNVDCEVDRNGIELLYNNICNSFKATAEKSNSWKEYMTDVFDSYVNPDNDPDVRPLVAGLDVEDFAVEKIPGVAVALTPDDDGPDYESSLSERQRLKIQSDLLATAAEPQRMTRYALGWSTSQYFSQRLLQRNMRSWEARLIHQLRHHHHPFPLI
ncbi:hypothetical protein R1sor_024286 [Riccia sorocarpa]|uniref:Uncharacterized protein n=1 Tax=Riccia sorocarpa TaxID=122646 RepID=A0ABD3GQ42_9MARC